MNIVYVLLIGCVVVGLIMELVSEIIHGGWRMIKVLVRPQKTKKLWAGRWKHG